MGVRLGCRKKDVATSEYPTHHVAAYTACWLRSSMEGARPSGTPRASLCAASLTSPASEVKQLVSS